MYGHTADRLLLRKPGLQQIGLADAHCSVLQFQPHPAAALMHNHCVHCASSIEKRSLQRLLLLILFIFAV